MAHKLTDEKIAEFKCAFELFDKDGSGQISAEELATVLKNLNQKPSASDLKEMIDEIDTDGNGLIDFDEFVDIMASKMKDNDSEEEIAEAFKILDKENLNYITKFSLRQMAHSIGEEMTEEEINELFKDYCSSNNNQMNFSEFNDMMRLNKKE